MVLLGFRVGLKDYTQSKYLQASVRSCFLSDHIFCLLPEGYLPSELIYQYVKVTAVFYTFTHTQTHSKKAKERESKRENLRIRKNKTN